MHRVPNTTSVAHAAALSGWSRPSFTRLYVHSGLVETIRSAGGRPMVVVLSLQHALGRIISADDWLAAHAKLDRSRAWQRHYRNQVQHQRRGVKGHGHNDRPMPDVQTPA